MEQICFILQEYQFLWIVYRWTPHHGISSSRPSTGWFKKCFRWALDKQQHNWVTAQLNLKKKKKEAQWSHNWPCVLMWSLRSLSVAKRLEQCEHWNLWPTWQNILDYYRVFFNITKLHFINLTESTFHGALSYDVVKQLCIVGIHPPTAGTCHHLFLSVAAQVLSQLRTAFSSSFTVWKWQAQSLDSKIWNPQLNTENVQLYNLHLTNIYSLKKTL